MYVLHHYVTTGGVFTRRGFGHWLVSQYHDPVDVGSIFGKCVVECGVVDSHEHGHDSFLPWTIVMFGPICTCLVFDSAFTHPLISLSRG